MKIRRSILSDRERLSALKQQGINARAEQAEYQVVLQKVRKKRLSALKFVRRPKVRGSYRPVDIKSIIDEAADNGNV